MAGANEGHCLREGPLCLGLCHAQGPHHQAHDPREDHRPLARSVWEEAIGYTASEFRRIQAKHGKDSIGGITSSRCTNEEAYLVQKMVRTAFGNNNVDTCARVCHSPTGYGLKQTFGTSAGTQTFKSVDEAHGRDHGDRRQSHGCAPGVRLAHEEARLRARRQAHRH